MKKMLLEPTSQKLVELEAKLGKAGVKPERELKHVTLLCADGKVRRRRVVVNIEEAEAWFWAMAYRTESGCWEWMGNSIKGGYGSLRANGKSRTATSVVFFLLFGRFPSLCMCHKCDNPGCINPSHLFEGTKQDNADDAKLKNRTHRAFGSANHRCKFTESEVYQIRISPLSCAKTAIVFGTCASHVCNIKRGLAWPMLAPSICEVTGHNVGSKP